MDSQKSEFAQCTEWIHWHWELRQNSIAIILEWQWGKLLDSWYPIASVKKHIVTYHAVPKKDLHMSSFILTQGSKIGVYPQSGHYNGEHDVRNHTYLSHHFQINPYQVENPKWRSIKKSDTLSDACILWLPSGNQTWLAGKYTIQFGDVPLETSMNRVDFPACHIWRNRR